MKPLALALALSLAASMSAAAPVVHKDWITGEGVDDVRGQPSCLAATSAVTGTHRAQLVISGSKDGLTPPHVLLKVWGAPAEEGVLRVPASSKLVHEFFAWKAAASTDEPAVYWYAPVALPKLMDTLAAANTMTVAGATVQSKISLRGSSSALSAWRKCLGKAGTVPEDFLKKLNAKTTLADAGFASVQGMIDGVQRAFDVDREGTATTKELAGLRAGAKKLLAQEKSALSSFNDALSRWKKVNDNLIAQREKDASLRKTLADANGDLAAKTAELPVAEEDLRVKKATYEPVRAQMEPLFKEVDARQEALDSNVRETKRLQNRIAEIDRAIPELRRERSRLDSVIQSLESRVWSARRAYGDAENEARSYDVESRVRSDMDSDFQVRWARDRIQRSRREADQARGEASSARSRLSSLQSALASCRANPQANCTTQQNEVNAAQNTLSQAENRERSAESSARSAEWDLDRAVSNLRSKHESERRRLDSIADDKERAWRGLVGEQDAARSRRSWIDSEIPDLQAEAARARKRIPVLQEQKPQLEVALADAQGRRDDLTRRIDYVRIEKEYKDAVARVDGLKMGIAAAKTLITKTEKEIKKLAPLIAALIKDEAAKAKKRDAAAAKLAPIQEALKPFRTKESELTARLGALTAEFETLKARFQRTIATRPA